MLSIPVGKPKLSIKIPHNSFKEENIYQNSTIMYTMTIITIIISIIDIIIIMIMRYHDATMNHHTYISNIQQDLTVVVDD